jgi:GAF domain-containing protein
MATGGDRLHLLHELNRGLTAALDLKALLQYVTVRARELFRADGCALLLLDRERREFYFPFVSDSDRAFEVRLQAARFPADSGIAGWVLAHDQPVRINDASQDPRFYSGVDEVTQMTTHAVLCAPLRTAGGNIGVIEVINPAAEFLTDEDVEFLETLAGDVAIGYEKTRLVDNLRGEVHGLRQALRSAGVGLIVAGVVCVLGAILGHLAHALPVAELFLKPGVWMGVIAAAAGVLLLATGRGWLIGGESKRGA